MNEMNKPITMAIKETKSKMISAINESGLSPVILDLIIQGIYSEIHTLAERQSADEEAAYMQVITHNDINVDKLEVGDADEQR